MEINHNPANLLPEEIREDITERNIDLNTIREIRIRTGQKIFVIADKKEEELEFTGNSKLINLILENATGHSLYAYEEAIRNGYITIEGGHRIGISGQVVMEEGKIKTIKNISSLNIRFARQVFGAADSLIERVVISDDEGFEKIVNVLVISPPGYGKTTILRDIVRQVSGRNIKGHKINVSVVDERGEISAMHKGSPANNIGSHTDVLEGCNKKDGMIMLIRTMTPDVLCIDEIGLSGDVEALRYVINCGCNIFASVHGTSLEDVRKRPIVNKIFEEKIFDLYVFLKEKAGKEIILYDKDFNEIMTKE